MCAVLDAIYFRIYHLTNFIWYGGGFLENLLGYYRKADGVLKVVGEEERENNP